MTLRIRIKQSGNIKRSSVLQTVGEKLAEHIGKITGSIF